MKPRMEMPGFPAQRLSSFSHPAAECFDAWYELFSKASTRLQLDTAAPAEFRASLHLQPLPTLLVSTSTLTGCSLTRTPSLCRDGDDGLTLVLCKQRDAEVEMRFGKDHLPLQAGMATLVRNDQCGGFHSKGHATTGAMRIERDLIRHFAPRFEDAIMRPILPQDPAFAIFLAYMEALLAQRDGLPLAAATLANSQIQELLAHLLNPCSDLARASPYGGIKAARLRAIQDDIAANLCGTSLSAAAVGARLGVSARYVQQLFEGVGLSFSDYVRDRRLDLARRLLADPRQAHLRIIEICALAGFNNLSYFNRCFRAHFGLTPTDARRGPSLPAAGETPGRTVIR